MKDRKTVIRTEWFIIEQECFDPVGSLQGKLFTG